METPGSAYGVAVSGTHAYVADEEAGLQVIDITNPQSPQIVGSVDTPGYGPWRGRLGHHAYVADGESGLQVIDITNPQSPQIVGSVDTPGNADGVAVSGTHAYVADYGFRSPGDRHHESPESPDRGQRGHAGVCLWRGRLGHPRLRRGLRVTVSR